MSQEELVDAYVAGEISRRTLIRRLTAGGVALGAATAYAQLLSPKAEAAQRGVPPEYPRVTLRIVSKDLNRVVRRGAVRAEVRVAEPFRLKLEVLHRGERIGKRNILPEGGRRTFQVKLDDVGGLASSSRAAVTVRAVHKVRNKDVRHVVAKDTAVLKA